MLNGIPTRVAETRESCLDHFLVKEHHKTITIKTSLSDHFPVLLLLNDEMETKSCFTNKFRDLRKLKNEQTCLNYLFCLYTELQKLEKNSDMNVDNRVSSLVNVMNTLLDRFAPWKNMRTWYNKKIKSQITKQNQLFKNWLQDKNDENCASYKKREL